jgi:hypothetical protein
MIKRARRIRRGISVTDDNGKRAASRKESLSALGVEMHKEGSKLTNKALLFGLILVLLHILEVRPSEISAGGLKVDVADISVVHGGVALIFYWYIFQLITTSLSSNSLAPYSQDKSMLRMMLRSAERWKKDSETKRRVRRTSREIKQSVRVSYCIYVCFSLPFVFGILGLILLGLILGGIDIYALGAYAADRMFDEDFGFHENLINGS